MLSSDAARELDAPVPKITFVVVGKRHHVRFMPKHPSEGDRRSGNCPAGLIVDREIVSPAVFDFYLQSHSGLLGSELPFSITFEKTQYNANMNSIQVKSLYLHGR